MQLALYKYDSCGFCRRVLQALRVLGIEDQIELRDVMQERAFQEELWQARGRGTVPVLRIEHEDGRVEWMGESADIIAWLRARFDRSLENATDKDG